MAAPKPRPRPYEIVIPVFDDEENLVNLLDSLADVGVSPCDVIVSMSGPKGNIDKLKASYGFRLLYSENRQGPSATRNKGAGETTADYIMFLDSDVLVSKQWKVALDEITEEKSVLLAGDTVHVSATPNWLERFWFSQMERGERKYINSANVLVRQDLFQDLGGFNEKLDSGEDYDFSIRSAAYGAPPVFDKRLKVFHEGYPKSVMEFLKRERWHASGDLGSIKAFMASRVMLAATLYVLISLTVLATLITANWSVFLPAALAFLFFPLGLTLYKLGWDGKSTVLSYLIMNFYLAGRGSALIGLLSRPLARAFNLSRI
ncbi:glycosyltransferase family 2 protein [Marinobacter salicampi]|uniref:glycosyltransferase family 2 protein n=1 Tax=Marinobacter salicampi TaxID=435907 RepID=UPI00140A76E0|nr:glycosyltransferase [Marinobacter salicampi]